MDHWTLIRLLCILYVMGNRTTCAVPRSYSRLDGAGGLLAGLSSNYKERDGRLLAHISEDPYIEDDPDDCERLPPEELGEILGAAYNTRYMSIQTPFMAPDDDDDQFTISGINSRKRFADGDEDQDFAVDDTFVHELSDQPAWAVNHATLSRSRQQSTNERQKRSTADGNRKDEDINRDTRYIKGSSGGAGDKMKRPWECEARIKWIDLGDEYFPRYLRTVECAKTQCFYGRFTCQPRSFTIKLLRRRPGQCVSDSYGEPPITTEATHQEEYRTGETGLPAGLRELWVWEERAVNFCCDCAAASSHRKY